jgi:hypothetical protein
MYSSSAILSGIKKIIFFTVSLVFLSPIFFSCDSAKTPQEYMREEKKAIERYIDRSGIIVLENYPSDGKFKDNEYFKSKDGLYFHVINEGNSEKKVAQYDEVMVRYEYYCDIKKLATGDSTKYYLDYFYFPITFKYNIPGSYNPDLVCSGWIIPLEFIYEGAIVDMIVPSSLGSQTNNSVYRPIFYKNLQYTRFLK